MPKTYFIYLGVVISLWLSIGNGQSPSAHQKSAPDTAEVYTYRTPTPGGTGKVYMGREISKPIRSTAASWLDRPNREAEEAPDSLVANLPLRPEMVVADLGAGSGYYTFRISPLVPQGKVIAVDIALEMLKVIQEKRRKLGANNVMTIQGTASNPNLQEASIDLVLMVDAYHEFNYPREIMSAIAKALRPGGQVVLVENRAEDPKVRKHPLHKMSREQIIREMGAAGFIFQASRENLPLQHFMIFVQP